MSRLKTFPIGLSICSRCGGNDPCCPVCQDMVDDEDDGPDAEQEHQEYLADCMRDKIRDDQWEKEQEEKHK